MNANTETNSIFQNAFVSFWPQMSGVPVLLFKFLQVPFFPFGLPHFLQRHYLVIFCDYASYISHQLTTSAQEQPLLQTIKYIFVYDIDINP